MNVQSPTHDRRSIPKKRKKRPPRRYENCKKSFQTIVPQIRIAPINSDPLLHRRFGSLQLRRAGGSAPEAGAAREILDLLRDQGALFYDDLVRETGRLTTDVERGLWELVARGLVTADGFGALRSLIASSKRRHFRSAPGAHRARLFRSLAVGQPSGRWSLLPSITVDAALDSLAEAWAQQLLFRYGVVFWDIVQRENVSVPWREMLKALRRMEARGEIRGGRFAGGFYGEQYARPEAVESLRKARRSEQNGELVRVSAVDPLNLAGIVTPGPRIPAVHTKSAVFRDGLPLSEEEGTQALTAARHVSRRLAQIIR